MLHVGDVHATASWYRDMLGFKWDFGDAEYAVVWRDNSAIHFAKSASPAFPGIHLFQWIRDVDAYCREIRERGADVLEEPEDRP